MKHKTVRLFHILDLIRCNMQKGKKEILRKDPWKEKTSSRLALAFLTLNEKRNSLLIMKRVFMRNLSKTIKSTTVRYRKVPLNQEGCSQVLSSPARSIAIVLASSLSSPFTICTFANCLTSPNPGFSRRKDFL